MGFSGNFILKNWFLYRAIHLVKSRDLFEEFFSGWMRAYEPIVKEVPDRLLGLSCFWLFVCFFFLFFFFLFGFQCVLLISYRDLHALREGTSGKISFHEAMECDTAQLRTLNICSKKTLFTNCPRRIFKINLSLSMSVKFHLPYSEKKINDFKFLRKKKPAA